jgi:type VI secretion system protein ImpG
MDRRYYEDELRYLQEAGRAFADAHPEQAAYLNVDSVEDRDPYVERLFEGFAVLTGRIRERLDDEMPAYTEGLLELVAPHLLRPVPSLAVVAFTPAPGLLQEAAVLARGTEVRSRPVGPEQVACRFRTTAPVTLRPLRLAGARAEDGSAGPPRLRLKLNVERGAAFADLDWAAGLRLYLHADASLAGTCHRLLTRHVRSVSCAAEDGSSAVLPGPSWVRAAGFAPDEGLLPRGGRSFRGFRLLQEYLCFRQKFWFVDLYGLDRLSPPAGCRAVTVTLELDEPWPAAPADPSDVFRLHCAPVVNLFERSAEPIRAGGHATAYRVRPSVRATTGIETYDVQSVVGVESGTGARHTYTPYASFQHVAAGPRPAEDAATGRTFRAHRRQRPDGTDEVLLSLEGTDVDSLLRGESQTLSVALRCTNGALPHAELAEGDLDRLAPGVAHVAVPMALTRPTPIRRPPAREGYFWHLVSHLSLNALPLASREALVGLLALYDWTGSPANRRRLEGIRDVTCRPKEAVHRGAVIRGTEVVLTVRAGCFRGEGDLCLFGAVLSATLALYATINSFVHLTLAVEGSERRYTWTPRRGAQPLL